MATKQKTVAKLREEAAVLLQKLVRMKAADVDGIAQCVTCGKKQHYKEMDGGHFISRKYTDMDDELTHDFLGTHQEYFLNKFGRCFTKAGERMTRE